MSDRKKRKRLRASILRRQFTMEMQKKLVMLFGAIMLAFLVLVGRVAFINASSGEEYARIVLDQQQYNNSMIPFKRGDILDTTGTKLATSERVYNIVLDATVLLSDEKKKDVRIAADKEILSKHFDIDPNTVSTLLSERPNSPYIVLKKQVPYMQAKAFEAEVEENENVVGLWLEEDYLRSYPYGMLACDLIGFSVSGNVGAGGLEAYYNNTLNGTDGRRYGYRDTESNTTKTVKEPVNGNNIVTTIDANLQGIVEKHLQAFYDAHINGGEVGGGFTNGAVIVMNPNTGEILSMASLPGYDLNNPRDLTGFYDDEVINSFSSEEKLDALNKIWRNFCVSDTYEPGSTMKPFIVAAALDTGVLNGDETFDCAGYLHVDDYDIQCISFGAGGHGWQDLSDTLVNSCNVALMEIGLDLGAERLSKYQHIFGFGEYTGLDVGGEAAGILYNKDNMIDVDIATNSFGQNINVTMVQLAAGYCSLVNGGNYYQPHVVKAIQNSDGDTIKSFDPVLLKRTISKQTSDMLKSYMYNVVEYGAEDAQVEGYDVGGKTGTAEKYPRGENKNVVSFIGYAPQENPEVVVYVVIDEPNVPNQAASNGLICQLASEIMSEAFPYLGITRNDDWVDYGDDGEYEDDSDEYE